MWPLALVLAGVIAWLQTPELHWSARAWTTFLLVPFPALMVLQARELRRLEALPRVPAYISSIASLWVLLLLTLLVARLAGFDAAALGMRATGFQVTLLAAAALTAIAVALLVLFRLAGFREATVLHLLLPQTGRERALFVLVSLTAGIAEEIIFRGFLLHALTVSTGWVPLAVLISSGAFGVVHAYQSGAGAARAALLGVLLALPVVSLHTLVPGIIAHVLIDLIAGLWLARWLLRD